MNIVILHTDFRIYWPARLKALHRFLKEKGHSLTVIEIAGKGSPYSFAGHIDISDIPSWHILFPDQRVEDVSKWKIRKKIKDTLNQLNPDIVLSGAIAFYSGANALKWAYLKNKPLVVFDNARLQDVDRNLFVNVIKRDLYKLVDSIFCPAPSHVPSFNYWGIHNESIFFGLNCVDNEFFEKSAENETKNHPKNHLPEKYFLSVGQQIKKKNISFLIKSYKQYLTETKLKPFPLVIVGNGPLHNRLKLEAGDLIDTYIFFLPFQTQEELIPIYVNAVAYILPSLYGETWGLTVNEAMNCGKPVIVSNQCGCCEALVQEGANGWIFNPGSISELTAILLKAGSLSGRELDKMGVVSNEIINQWGLEHFVDGMWESINYAINWKRNKRRLLVSGLLSFIWNGRFRLERQKRTKKIAKLNQLVFMHTDLRIYWQARLQYLQKILSKLDIQLTVIEISGKGSPYSFNESDSNHKDLKWEILFPDRAIEEISSYDIQHAIKAKLKVLNPDIVVAGALAFSSGAGALKWNAKRRKPIIIFDDARPEDVIRPWIVNKLKQVFYRNVDAVICPAPSHARGFTRWGLKNEEIFYGVDVIDNDFFAKENKSITLKKDFPGSFILAVGRQIERKNWIGLLDAFIEYKNANAESNLNLVFIGNGPLHQLLQNKITEQHREDVFMIPFVQQEELIQYYHQAKGLILPSFYGETWGLVVNEAMAAGLPVLVSKECGCAETLIQEGMNGWSFDPHDVSRIAIAIEKLDALTQSQWEQMSLKSIEIIRGWGLPQFTKGMLDALNYVTDKPIRKSYWLANFLSGFWHGRYRQV